MKKMWSVAAIGAAFVFGFIAQASSGEPVVMRSPLGCTSCGRTRRRMANSKNCTRASRTTRCASSRSTACNVAYFRPAGLAALAEHDDLSDRAPEPRGGQAELGRVRKDPEWQKVAQESQVNGKIVAKVDSVFLDATDYSPMK